MFKRKRDWPMLVYKFRVYLEPEDVPQRAWDKADELRQVWNALTRIWRTAHYETGLIEDKNEKKARWKQCSAEIKAALDASPLDSEYRQDLNTRFYATLKRLNFARGEKPQYQNHLDRICLFHRYSGGGMAPKGLLSQRATRVRLTPPDVEYPNGRTPSSKDKHRTVTDGVFSLGEGEEIKFRVRLHRPIRKDAIVKRAVFSGKRDIINPDRWEWYLNISAEVPHAIPQPRPHQTVAIDFGWRLMGEGTAIRVAYCRDNEGREFELRLNLLEEKSRFAHEGKYFIPSNYPAWIAYDAQIGDRVELCKNQLKEMLPAKLTLGLDKMRQGGLRHMQERLIENKEFTACEAIESCFRDLTPIMRRRNALAGRLTRKRQYLYLNFAAWLTTTYQEIIWENELKIKDLKSRENKKNNPALQNAGKFAQWAAPGELREMIKKATVKNAAILTGGETAGSTITCSECQAEMLATANIIIECPACGTAWDQDANACRNLLKFSQIIAEDEQAEGLRKNGKRISLHGLAIPEVLRSVVVSGSVT